jgi:hypothetical protein
MSSGLYGDHARLLNQMAQHLKLCTPHNQFVLGAHPTVTTNDAILASTFFDSIYGYPGGKNLVEKMLSAVTPGRDQKFQVLDIVSVSVSSSEFDETIAFSFNAMPGKEPHTAQLFKEAAEYAQRRAGTLARTIAPPSRAITQRER